MCLDPRPERPFRVIGPARVQSPRRPLLRTQTLARSSVVVRASARRALEHLAGDDELVARGWVVLSRQA